MDSNKLKFVADFTRATYQQLQQVVENEDCELIYKCVAQAEIEKRNDSLGMMVNAMKHLINQKKNLVLH